jgi:uncharacterized membrane protein
MILILEIGTRLTIILSAALALWFIAALVKARKRSEGEK